MTKLPENKEEILVNSHDQLLKLLNVVRLTKSKIGILGRELFKMTAKSSAFSSVFELKKISDFLHFGSQDLIVVDDNFIKGLKQNLWKVLVAADSQVLIISDKIIEQPELYRCYSSNEWKKAIVSFEKSIQKRFDQRFTLFVKGTKRALFLDRDGVVIEDRGYLSDPAEVSLIPKCVQLMKWAKKKGWAIIVITNQSGIGRDYFSMDDYHAVNNRMLNLLNEKGIWVDHIEMCPYYENSKEPFYTLGKMYRKPNAGMIKKISIQLALDLKKSWMIGDKATDLMAAALAGVGKGYLVPSKVHLKQLETWRSWPFHDFVKWGSSINYGWPELGKYN